MTPTEIIDVLREATYMGLLAMAPILLSAMVVGVAVSIVQTVTQISEQSLTFVPKLLVSALVFALTAPWMLSLLGGWLAGIIAGIPAVAPSP